MYLLQSLLLVAPLAVLIMADVTGVPQAGVTCATSQGSYTLKRVHFVDFTIIPNLRNREPPRC